MVIYPLTILGGAVVIAPEKRLGSLLTDKEGQVLGSRLIAQGFSRPEYLWSRPSAVNYDASAAGGSNLSPANATLRERAEKIIAALALGDKEPVPSDLVTASGAGLDPHISLKGALLQAPRIATARGLTEKRIVEIIEANAVAIPLTTDKEMLVNVLEANLALDALAEP
jgi:K+-transporting ATPase ATPase C chain